MQILKNKAAVRQLVNSFDNQGLSIGFVPTMGALHPGHLSLVQTALETCDKVIVSIFVNPTQFDNPEDLQKYPRSLERDVKLLEDLNPEIIVFSPDPAEIYEEGMVSEHFCFDGLEHQMEGKFRPGHFDGVGTVIKKLFSIVSPDKAFFGEKDFQQLQIIRKLTEKAGWDIEIVGCPISREPNGLARSSRNERLTADHRNQARVIYDVLQKVKADFGTKSVLAMKAMVSECFEKTPEFELEYFDIADSETLEPVQQIDTNRKLRAFIAAYCKDVRLIDNLALN